ncbi:MAG: hypothetical protein VX185_07995 [Pseudomonadota bacterium]|nr:hypothetical protein [Pseudomonadota bacterium]
MFELKSMNYDYVCKRFPETRLPVNFKDITWDFVVDCDEGFYFTHKWVHPMSLDRYFSQVYLCYENDDVFELHVHRECKFKDLERKIAHYAYIVGNVLQKKNGFDDRMVPICEKNKRIYKLFESAIVVMNSRDDEITKINEKTYSFEYRV